MFSYFCWVHRQFIEDRTFHKVLRRFDHFPWNFESTKFWIQRKCFKIQNILPLPFLHIFVKFTKNQPKFCDVFAHFSWSYEVRKVWIMFQLCLNVSDVIPSNEHTQYVHFILHVNFWNCCLRSLCFRIKKIILRKSFSFGLRSLLIEILLVFGSSGMYNSEKNKPGFQ